MKRHLSDWLLDWLLEHLPYDVLWWWHHLACWVPGAINRIAWWRGPDRWRGWYGVTAPRWSLWRQWRVQRRLRKEEVRRA